MTFLLQTGELILLYLTAILTFMASATTNMAALAQEVQAAIYVNYLSKNLSYTLQTQFERARFPVSQLLSIKTPRLI